MRRNKEERRVRRVDAAERGRVHSAAAAGLPAERGQPAADALVAKRRARRGDEQQEEEAADEGEGAGRAGRWEAG